MSRILPIGLLLLAAMPLSARADDVVEGENLRVVYSDVNGVWWGSGTTTGGTAVEGGIQMNVGGSWQDFMSSNDLWVFWGFEYDSPGGNPWEFFGGYGDQGSGANVYADWTMIDSGIMSTADYAMQYAEFSAGDLLVEKTESWDIAAQTDYVQLVLTNTSTSTDIENLRFMAAFNPFDRYNGSSWTLDDVQDLDGDGINDWAQSAGNASGATKRYTVGFYVCDPDTQELGHGSDDNDTDQALSDYGGLRIDATMHIRNTTEIIAAGDSVVVSFLVATGATDTQARTNALAGTGDCTTCDTDADAYENELCQGDDCDDHNEDIFPGAADAWYDGTDANCGDDDDFDADGDGHVPDEYADRVTDGVPNSGLLPADDCLDTDARAYLGAPETWYDGLDADCGGEDDFDQDGDGFVPDAYFAETTTNVPGSGRLPAGDCDDENASIKPTSSEIWYDGVDQDCDGSDDYDQDGDGYAADAYAAVSGLPGGDCDDLNPGISPGEIESWYDGVDQDCGGDDDYDQDGDGQVQNGDGGQPTAGVPGTGLLPDTDCDDTNSGRYAGATDPWYDGLDADCGGEDDFDQDGDGYVPDAYLLAVTVGVLGSGQLPGGDCNDTNASVNPGATEVWYDGVDQDCGGEDDFDQDNDGYDVGADCDDTDPSVNPGATDAWYDGIDSDCAGNNDYDRDVDGYTPDAYSAVAGLPGGDCDDADPTAHAGATETWYDGADQDCAGDDDYDQDHDGHADAALGGASSLPADDCNDTDASAYTGATETWYDGVDSDCDGQSDWDQDIDGHDEEGWDKDGDGVPDPDPDGDDCNDLDSGISPSAEEICYDGIDQNCVPDDEYDCDQDGHDEPWDRNGNGEIDNDDEDPDGNDCDDTDADVHPGAEEVCYDGADTDCDTGNEYDCDNDGHDAPGYDKDGDGTIDADEDGDDCDDSNAAVSPSAEEICYDGVDENCDYQSDFDCDLDSHESDAYGGDDCDDADADKWDVCPVDLDDDGWDDCGDLPVDGTCDCDDGDDQVHPGVSDTECDGFDVDCDGTEECDCDGDGERATGECGGRDACDNDQTTLNACVDGDSGGVPGYFKGGGGCSGEGCGSEEGAGAGASAGLLLGVAALLRRRNGRRSGR